MDLDSRRVLMDSMSKRYRQASKVSKTRILDEVCAATGFHRKYAITAFSTATATSASSRPTLLPCRGRTAGPWSS